jgi:hypothetical protein
MVWQKSAGFHTVGGFTPGMNLTWGGGDIPHQLEFFGKFFSGFENLKTESECNF